MLEDIYIILWALTILNIFILISAGIVKVLEHYFPHREIKSTLYLLKNEREKQNGIHRIK